MQGFGLDRTNRLQLINISPTNLLELLLVISLQATHCRQLRVCTLGRSCTPVFQKLVAMQAIDNCEARFSSSQMEELLALVKKHLKA